MTAHCTGPRHAIHADAMHAARALIARGTHADRLRPTRCGDHWHVRSSR